jgi:anthranilate phosphoribosyltransferase
MTDAASWPDVIGCLLRREELSTDAVEDALSTILRGDATDAQIAGFAVALRSKGETTRELAAMVRTMLRFAERVEVSDLDGLIDTCGTGGDRSGTVNVSTMAACIAVGAGARVAKHGNRAQSSQCGSADVLEALGVVVDLGPKGVERCIREAGFGFCLAPVFHPALRFAGPPRRELGVPTTFNFLGPLANPAGVKRQVVGVSDPAMADRVAGALAELGTEHALVFYGHDGLDELTTTTTSTVLELRDGSISTRELDPTSLGLARADRAALAGGGAAGNAEVTHRVLAGQQGPVRDIASLNAAAALVVAGVADDFAGGLERAFASIDGGNAAAALDALVRTSVAAREDGS